jgi:putative SOS response-associated peptidase YedK
MCGRFTMTIADTGRLADELGVPVAELAGYAPHYNIAPAQEHIIVRMKAETREVVTASWGLVNAWARDPSRAARAINARAETVATSPTFRDAFARRRCLVPADGFYEWEGAKDARRPSWIYRPDGGLLLFAGLYESWQPAPGDWRRTFAIITTDANGPVSRIHDRMPVILDPADADRWMHRNTPASELHRLLRPAPDDWLVLRPVSRRVNRVDQDDPGLLEEEPAAPRLL